MRVHHRDAAGDGVVLVVDDDAATRELLARFLERDGYRVAVAADGKEGLDKARSLAPRVILLDVTMPQMDGVGGPGHHPARRGPAGDAVVMVTVLDEQSRAYALGATDYLQKPVDWNELHTVMTDSAHGPSPRSEGRLVDDLDNPACARVH